MTCILHFQWNKRFVILNCETHAMSKIMDSARNLHEVITRINSRCDPNPF